MFDREVMIAAYNRRRDELLQIIDRLKPEDLDKPTVCEGWTVKDLIAHMATSASNVQMLMARHIAREPNPGAEALNERNARGVADRKGKSVTELVSELMAAHDANAAHLRHLSDQDLAVEGKLVSGQVIPAAQRFENAGLHYQEHGRMILDAIEGQAK